MHTLNGTECLCDKERLLDAFIIDKILCSLGLLVAQLFFKQSVSPTIGGLPYIVLYSTCNPPKSYLRNSYIKYIYPWPKFRSLQHNVNGLFLSLTTRLWQQFHLGQRVFEQCRVREHCKMAKTGCRKSMSTKNPMLCLLGQRKSLYNDIPGQVLIDKLWWTERRQIVQCHLSTNDNNVPLSHISPTKKYTVFRA